ncbi:MAG TPA: DinB family protein [Longimicrobiales bacterium]|nr:DinB family protein [Longimicrobiales bacterium]
MHTLKGLRSLSLIALGAAALAPAATRAQAPAQGGPRADGAAAPVVVEALLRDIERLEEKMMGLADAIPESAYGWRPAEGVRSVSEVIMHVAADNFFLPTVAGVAAPEASGIKAGDYPSVQAFENRTASRAEAQQALRESFAHLRTAMQGSDDALLARNLEIFGMQMTGLDLWVMTTTHLHEHLGQMIAYARSNEIVPPWSRGN